MLHFLQSVLPANDATHVLLLKNWSVLERMFGYFAAYPFGQQKILWSFKDCVRATAFLTGRTAYIFHQAGQRDTGRLLQRDRIEEMSHEMTFRSLAIPLEDGAINREVVDEDILETLCQVQPRLNDFTYPLTLDDEDLLATTKRLSPGRIPLTQLSVSKSDLINLFALLSVMLKDVKLQPASPL
jgi:hypothetical protein